MVIYDVILGIPDLPNTMYTILYLTILALLKLKTELENDKCALFLKAGEERVKVSRRWHTGKVGSEAWDSGPRTHMQDPGPFTWDSSPGTHYPQPIGRIRELGSLCGT